MVLGCYYLTADNPKVQRTPQDRFFASFQDVLIAHEQKLLSLHSWVWVRHDGAMELGKGVKETFHVTELPDGTRVEQSEFRRRRLNRDGSLISQYIHTTPGRIIFHEVILKALAS
jgi:DNA-directed RNA polymerase subunit beta'